MFLNLLCVYTPQEPSEMNASIEQDVPLGVAKLERITICKNFVRIRQL